MVDITETSFEVHAAVSSTQSQYHLDSIRSLVPHVVLEESLIIHRLPCSLALYSTSHLEWSTSFALQRLFAQGVSLVLVVNVRTLCALSAGCQVVGDRPSQCSVTT